MIDDKKIEAAKEEIYEDRFLLNGVEIVFNNDEKEEMFYKEDIKEAIGLGAKWAINELLKDLWHDVDEIPKRAKAFIFECGDYSMNYHVGMMLNPNDYKKNAEIWHMNRWCYLEDILPKQEGGNHD